MTASPVGRPLQRSIFRILGFLVLLIAAVLIAFRVSPWPKAMIIRYMFNKGGKITNQALEKHVPPGITAQLNLPYAPGDKDALLDVYYPSAIAATDSVLPTIVWIHGGAWIAGSKNDVANYCKILSSKGFTVIAIDYSLAPGKKYPTPVVQSNQALAYIRQNAHTLHANTDLLFLAGDSGGAQLAAQLANLITSPDFARQMNIIPAIDAAALRGAILYCGAYDAGLVDVKGPMANFLNTVLWSYSGTKDFMNDTSFARLSVVHYADEHFPATFISVGNDDPLRQHSYELSKVLSGKQVSVDSLFFPEAYLPKLPHEYQFDLDLEAGRTALDRSVQFIQTHIQ